MNNSKPLMWRKGIILSATFLFALFVAISCKKKANTIGQNSINQNELLSSNGIDTFSLNTYTIQDDIDSLKTSGAINGILGSYVDPVFGPAEAGIYTELRLKAFNPNFVDGNTIQIDSFVLGLQYAGYYGESGVQSVEVYEITEADGLIDTADYYMTSSLATSTSNLVTSGMGDLDFNTSNATIIDSQEYDPQLRIYLDTNLARSMIDHTFLSPGDFQSQEAFTDYFKGLYIKTNNVGQNVGEGGLFYFDMNDSDTKLTIYYTQDGLQKRYDFVITTDCPKFNAVTIDHTFTDIETVLADSTQGQDQFYAQAFGSRGRIEIPGLDNIPSNAIIHQATLTIPVSYQTGYKYGPSNDITVTTLLEDGGYSFYGFIGYDNFNKQYEIDLRAYVQAVINDQVENTGLALSPVLYISSGDRIVFNGSNSVNKAKPRLNIVYTEF